MRVTVYGDSILKGVRMENGRYLVDREWERAFADRCHSATQLETAVSCPREGTWNYEYFGDFS